MQLLSAYKREILAAVIGALFTGTISLGAGLYSLTKSFELTQKKEITATLRTDINYLKATASELDKNLNLLLNQNYKIIIESHDTNESLTTIKDPTMKSLIYFYSSIAGNMHIVTKSYIPKDMFYVSAWPYYGPEVTEIDFDLSDDVTNLYRTFGKINYTISQSQLILQGILIPSQKIEELNNLKDSLNSDISSISKDKLLEIRNKISKAIQQLENRRDKIFDS